MWYPGCFYVITLTGSHYIALNCTVQQQTTTWGIFFPPPSFWNPKTPKHLKFSILGSACWEILPFPADKRWLCLTRAACFFPKGFNRGCKPLQSMLKVTVQLTRQGYTVHIKQERILPHATILSIKFVNWTVQPCWEKASIQPKHWLQQYMEYLPQ